MNRVDLMRFAMPGKRFVLSLLVLLIVSILGLGYATTALAAGPLKIQLNKLKEVDNACRVYMVFRNDTGRRFNSLKLDLIMFGKDGVIARRLAVQAAPLPVDKTRVKLFDIDHLACDSLDRILFNDILECKGAGGKQRRHCMQAIKLYSLSDVALVK